jgi:collagenase-like PrtC family protease
MATPLGSVTHASRPELTLGPILFHWPAERKLDFYARIADEGPVDTVYLGEIVCSKRAPFFDRHYPEAAERLKRGGKRVVFSSFSEVMLKRERDAIADLCALADFEVEINEASGLFFISGRPHRIGPMLNVYNEETLAHLAKWGARHVCLPIELPRTSVAVLAGRAGELGVGLEVQVFGRASLAISARCYHARAHGRVKDNCQFVCEQDPDGMPLRTLEGREFLAVNGVQTLSHAYVCMLSELADMAAIGVRAMRLSPHTLDMVRVAQIFRDVADKIIDPEEAESRMLALGPLPRLANGYWHGRAGQLRIHATQAPASAA